MDGTIYILTNSILINNNKLNYLSKESVIDEKNEQQESKEDEDEDEDEIIDPIIKRSQDLQKCRLDFEKLVNDLKEYEEELKIDNENIISNELMEKFAIVNYDAIKSYDSKVQTRFENIVKSKSIDLDDLPSKSNNPFGKSFVCSKSSSNLINLKTNELNFKLNILKENYENEKKTAIEKCDNLINQFENCYVVHS